MIRLRRPSQPKGDSGQRVPPEGTLGTLICPIHGRGSQVPHKGTSTVYESSSAIQHGKTARCLSVEASWDGDVLGRWTLSAGERLRAGPEPENELLVAETLMPKAPPHRLGR